MRVLLFILYSLFFREQGEERRETMKENILLEKSLDFATRIIKLRDYLIKKKETTIAKQIIRSATSIGANANEAIYGVTKPDFINKLHIALKECAETEYWLKLILKAGYIEEKLGESLLEDCLELKKILVASVKTAKGN